MAVSPLDTQQIVAVIRQEIVSRVSKVGTPPVPVEPPKTQGGRTSRQTAKPQQIGALIARRVKAIRPDDPDRGRKAFRIFLESVLINELGESLINDPGFYDMVDQIQQQMEQHPAITAAMQDAIGKLLKGAA
ncbi:MAG: hypothetical protein JO142_15130 [Burkholderiales bacterium]|nr:hypothetical protein [Burkholderiales bacterium]